MLKYSDLSGKSVSELLGLYQERKLEHFHLRLKKGMGANVNTARMRECRREVARLLTCVRVLRASKK